MVKNAFRSIVVEVPQPLAYAIWSDFACYPQFLPHVKEVRVADRRLVFRETIGADDVELEAEIVEMTRNERIAWRRQNGPSHVAVVTTRKLSGERTEVILGVEYKLHAGERDVTASRLEQHLNHFKEFAEAMMKTMPSGADVPDDAVPDDSPGQYSLLPS